MITSFSHEGSDYTINAQNITYVEITLGKEGEEKSVVNINFVSGKERAFGFERQAEAKALYEKIHKAMNLNVVTVH
ncbi:hypothetical protein [uncultured Fibrobacter sp.]|uniref:hypothetical protein n=1 Tax=uncultured Fibrobacter sp. TaxID=261512 RepID=UPI0026002941|nr:hypothetical protein [uncultured Fibrobacter sp.]